jgi:hypothetical protein
MLSQATAQIPQVQIWHIDRFVLYARNLRKNDAAVDGPTRTTSIGFADPRQEHGELLWGERFGATEIESLKRSLGSYAAAGQLQQRPSPAGGGLLTRALGGTAGAAEDQRRNAGPGVYPAHSGRYGDGLFPMRDRVSNGQLCRPTTDRKIQGLPCA